MTHFKRVCFYDAGDPVSVAEAYDKQGADEIVFLDITASHEKRGIIIDIVKHTAEKVFMPLTVGGGIASIDDIRQLLNAGADKPNAGDDKAAAPARLIDDPRSVDVFRFTTRSGSGIGLYLSRNLNNPDALVRFFTDLERLAAGMMIMRVPLNDRLRRYGQLLSAIERDDDLYALGSPLQLTQTEQDEMLEVLNGNLYQIKPRVYVLLRLDVLLADAGAVYNHPILTVEHVLPQNPALGSIWTDWFPAQEERARYVHRLGNLVLLSRRKNSQAQNYDFAKKKSQYFTGSVANFALTNQVLNEQEWTPAVIERRQRVLVGKLKELWRL